MHFGIVWGYDKEIRTRETKKNVIILKNSYLSRELIYQNALRLS